MLDAPTASCNHIVQLQSQSARTEGLDLIGQIGTLSALSAGFGSWACCSLSPYFFANEVGFSLGVIIHHSYAHGILDSTAIVSFRS